MIRKLLCPTGHWLSVDDFGRGGQAQCPRCSALVTIPLDSPDAVPGNQRAKRSPAKFPGKFAPAAGRSPGIDKQTTEPARSAVLNGSSNAANGHVASEIARRNGAISNGAHANGGPSHETHLNGANKNPMHSNGAHPDGANGVYTNVAYTNRSNANGVYTNGAHSNGAAKNGALVLEEPANELPGLSAPMASAKLPSELSRSTGSGSPPRPPLPKWPSSEAAGLAYTVAERAAMERRFRKPRTYGVSLAIALFACLQVAPIFLAQSFELAPRWAQATALLAALEIVYSVWVALTPDWAAPRVAMFLFGLLSTAYAVALGIGLFSPPGKPALLQIDEVSGKGVLWLLFMLGGSLAVTHFAAWVSFSWRSRWRS